MAVLAASRATTAMSSMRWSHDSACRADHSLAADRGRRQRSHPGEGRLAGGCRGRHARLSRGEPACDLRTAARSHPLPPISACCRWPIWRSSSPARRSGFSSTASMPGTSRSNPLLTWLARRVDRVISISEVTTQRFQSWAICRKIAIRLLPCTVDLERLPARRPRSGARRPLRSGRQARALHLRPAGQRSSAPRAWTR